jgi:hypothetical protein
MMRAIETYSKLVPCLLDDSRILDYIMENSDIEWKYPVDAEKHYVKLLEETKIYRDHSPHTWAKYSGWANF